MQEIFHEPNEPLQRPQNSERQVVVHDDQHMGTAQTAISPEAAEATTLPRLRRVARFIADHLRLGNNSSNPKEPADEIYDDGVDEFGLPKTLLGTHRANVSTEQWYDTAFRRTGEFVKRAPRFIEQVNDTSRTNLIEYMADASIAVGTETQGRKTAAISEHDTLVAIRDFLGKASDYTNHRDEHSLAPLAKSMIENLTFIGEREYKEAIAGIADKWRRRLNSSATTQLCISAAIAEGDSSVVKSSGYLLDNILKHFSDEELVAWKGRLVLDPSELTSEPKNAAIILLDDWTISGAQLKYSAQSFIDRYPQYQKRLEVQLVAASQDRVRNGLELDSPYDRAGPVPIDTYYVAHEADEDMAGRTSVHITGAHCAVDYDYNDLMSSMAITLGVHMPPGTNIVRPYRKPGYKLTQSQRLGGLH